jgi:pyruvate/2-oxoglutarate/acetoin dehydrogenase E1 component
MARIISYNRALQEAITEELERDDTVFFMGEDVASYGGAFGMSKGILQRFGERRVFDTPLSETLIVGAGVGAAITGLRPIVELQFADFVAVAMDEIYNKAAKWRYMHGGLFKVPLVILMPEGAAGGAGPALPVPGGALLVGAWTLRAHTIHACGRKRAAQDRNP